MHSWVAGRCQLSTQCCLKYARSPTWVTHTEKWRQPLHQKHFHSILVHKYLACVAKRMTNLCLVNCSDMPNSNMFLLDSCNNITETFTFAWLGFVWFWCSKKFPSWFPHFIILMLLAMNMNIFWLLPDQPWCRGPVSVDAELHESLTTKGPAVPWLYPYPNTPRGFSRVSVGRILRPKQASQKGPKLAGK